MAIGTARGRGFKIPPTSLGLPGSGSITRPNGRMLNPLTASFPAT